MTLAKSVTLIGEGIDLTEIIGERGQYVLSIDAGITCEIQDLTVRSVAFSGSHAVVLSSGELLATRCRFTGGRHSKAGIGAGLLLRDAASGRVSVCLFEQNHDGVRILDQFQGTLEGNTFTHNVRHGVVVSDRATPVAQANTCEHNGKHGIHVQNLAQPLLKANVCRANEHCGIAYFDRSGGIACENQCTNNGRSGIRIQTCAETTVERNTCRQNGDSGIGYFSSSSGSALGNLCESNANYGIYVGENAAPVLHSNTCQDNDGDGIAVTGRSGAILRNNICQHNSRFGLWIDSHTTTQYENMTCEGNGRKDIKCRDQGNTSRSAKVDRESDQLATTQPDDESRRATSCYVAKKPGKIVKTVIQEGVQRFVRDNEVSDGDADRFERSTGMAYVARNHGQYGSMPDYDDLSDDSSD